MRAVRSRIPCRLLGGSSVLELKRLRFAGKTPVCLEWTYLPSRHERTISRADLSGSLYELLDRLGERLVRSEVLMLVRMPTRSERRLFAGPPALPVVEISRLAMNARGEPLEFTRNVLRADRYLFRPSLTRAPWSRSEP